MMSCWCFSGLAKPNCHVTPSVSYKSVREAGRVKVLIAGATGTVGKSLVKALLDRGDEVVAVGRSKVKIVEVFGQGVTAESYESLSKDLLQSLDAVVNLAGASIGESGAWTPEVKQIILDSRVLTPRRLSQALLDAGATARFLSASAIGIYGEQDLNDDAVMDEDTAIPQSSPDFFLGEVCRQWEAAAQADLPAEQVVLLRTGIVLCKGEGALGQMEMPFKMGVGGRMGSGEQLMSWISLEDEVRVILFCIDHPDFFGPVNLVAGTARQIDFAQCLAAAMHRPCLLPTPGFLLRLALGSDLAQELVLASQRIHSRRLPEAGFVFKDNKLAETLAKMYR